MQDAVIQLSIQKIFIPAICSCWYWLVTLTNFVKAIFTVIFKLCMVPWLMQYSPAISCLLTALPHLLSFSDMYTSSSQASKWVNLILDDDNASYCRHPAGQISSSHPVLWGATTDWPYNFAICASPSNSVLGSWLGFKPGRGPMTSYVGLYQETPGRESWLPPTLVGSTLVATSKISDRHMLLSNIPWLGNSWSQGKKNLFPAKYWHGVWMKIEQNGGKLWKLGGQMTLTLYVGLYQEKPGMTSQPALTQNYQGRPV